MLLSPCHLCEMCSLLLPCKHRLRSQNRLDWKRPFRSSSPTVNQPQPSCSCHNVVVYYLILSLRISKLIEGLIHNGNMLKCCCCNVVLYLEQSGWFLFYPLYCIVPQGLVTQLFFLSFFKAGSSYIDNACTFSFCTNYHTAC